MNQISLDLLDSSIEMVERSIHPGKPFKTQLLKWVGNKQKQAIDIIDFFPKNYGVYIEPFLGSGGVLGVLAPKKAIASDVFPPLFEIWETLHKDKEKLKNWYSDRYARIAVEGKIETYKSVLSSYNESPNGADFIFLLRTCYGGVVRFRKKDGYMSTPCGAHNPIPPESFSARVDAWFDRTQGAEFFLCDFEVTMDKAQPGDLIYCDPPYVDSQAILYGAQDFSLARLFKKIEECKMRGVFVALSIDGTKFSGDKLCSIDVPHGLFETEAFINVGRSMLKRFQMDGKSLESHVVTDRLLLTYNM
ncbi:DNA adenine methylase [Pseudomonas sp. DE0010]|uniref:DNA adenine methylase n=1 Tax=Pseudomonas sp. DE0010 TaxID=2584951 RepID=UPI0011A911F3|nr:DNA adenine methylase [Pseudomonas sp. DE0010]